MSNKKDSGVQSMNGSSRISESDGNVGVYDPIGQDSEDEKFFIRHIGLSLNAFEYSAGTAVTASMIEMIPPLTVPDETNDGDLEDVEIDIIANMELSASEVSRIKMFIEELVDEYSMANATDLAQYTIRPHFRERTGDDSVRRYSCVGFVIEAYRDTDLDLIDLTSLPDVDLESLILAYPDQEARLRHPRLRAFGGLAGDGPWPVLMPGYVFHALNRPQHVWRKTPYSPSPGDERFPRDSQSSQTDLSPRVTNH